MNKNGKNIIERWIYPINNNLIFIIMIAKKYFGLLAAVAVVAAAGWNYQQNKQSEGLSELVLANVEALATGEDFEVTCGRQEGKCWTTDYSNMYNCGEYTMVYGCNFTGSMSDTCYNPCI